MGKAIFMALLKLPPENFKLIVQQEFMQSNCLYALVFLKKMEIMLI